MDSPEGDPIKRSRPGVLGKTIDVARRFLGVWDTKLEKIPPDQITPQKVAQKIIFHIVAEHQRTGRVGVNNEFDIYDVLDKLGYPGSTLLGSPEYGKTRTALYVLARDGALIVESLHPVIQQSQQNKESLVYRVGARLPELKLAAEGRLEPKNESPIKTST